MGSIPKKNEESFFNASSSTNSHFLKIISEQIKDLEISPKGKAITCLDKTCQNQVYDTSSEEEEIDAQSSNSKDILNVIEEVFKDSSPPVINKIKNWHQG